MSRLIFTAILLTFYSEIIWPQFSKPIEVYTPAELFSIDNKENIYFIEGNHLFKSAPPYQSRSSFYFGKHDSNATLNTSNPNKILLFFYETQKLIILDSSLQTSIRPLYLDEIGMFDISLVAPSSDMGYCMYNEFDNSLTLLDELFIPKVRPIDLNAFFKHPKTPTFLYENDGKIFLNIPSDGILILNEKGQFVTLAPIKGLIDFQVLGDDIVYYRDLQIHIYNINEQKTRTIPLPKIADVLNTLWTKEKLFLQTKDKILIFRLK